MTDFPYRGSVNSSGPASPPPLHGLLFVVEPTARPQTQGEHDEPDRFRLENALRACGIQLVHTDPDHVFLSVLGRLPKLLRDTSPLRAIRALLTQKQHDFMLTVSPEAALLLAFARSCGLYRRPIILVDMTFIRQWRARLWVLKRCLPRADAVVAITKGQERIAAEGWGLSNVFPGNLSIDTAFFGGRAAEESPSDSYAFVPGEDIGRDYETVFRAMRIHRFPVVIKRSRHRVEIPADLAGDVTYLADRVPYREFRDLYQRASMVIVACRETENASGITVCAEAMCMGRPLIVTDTAVLRGEFPEGTCIQVPVGDPAALAEAVQWVHGNPSQARAMAMRAREFALAHFSPAAEAANIAHAIRSVLARRAGRA